MVRLSKQTRKRQKSHRRPAAPQVKTGAVKMAVAFRNHPNAIQGEEAQLAFIPKIK